MIDIKQLELLANKNRKRIVGKGGFKGYYC